MKISKITAVRIHCFSKESILMVVVERVRGLGNPRQAGHSHDEEN
jgi:hypothetical protein